VEVPCTECISVAASFAAVSWGNRSDEPVSGRLNAPLGRGSEARTFVRVDPSAGVPGARRVLVGPALAAVGCGEQTAPVAVVRQEPSYLWRDELDLRDVRLKARILFLHVAPSSGCCRQHSVVAP